MYALDECAFDRVTQESAYWVGFLMADGNVCSVRPRLRIALQPRDVEHLVKLATFLKTTAPIKATRGDHPMVWFQVTSRRIASTLALYGVLPRKSLTAMVCERLAYDRDFWRGVVDGDGSIRVCKEARICKLVSASPYRIVQFAKFVEGVVIGRAPRISVCCGPSRREPLYSVQLSGESSACLASSLYRNALVSLDRKQLLADKLMACYQGVLSGNVQVIEGVLA